MSWTYIQQCIAASATITIAANAGVLTPDYDCCKSTDDVIMTSQSKFCFCVCVIFFLYSVLPEKHKKKTPFAQDLKCALYIRAFGALRLGDSRRGGKYVDDNIAVTCGRIHHTINAQKTQNLQLFRYFYTCSSVIFLFQNY